MSEVNIRRWLLPLSYLYGLGVAVRNLMFNYGWLKTREFDIPTLCVGNLAVGGTGKTPHVELLIYLLRSEGYRVATLSRGYGRRTKGYLKVTEAGTPAEVGDEPCQLKRKFPQVTVAVCENRCHGIERLMLSYPRPDAILLDDAFQHRYVKAGLNILLTDYHRLFSDDRLLPAGLLRENESAKFRADVVVVTKCPADIKPIDFNITTKRLGLQPYQKLFFSSLRYGRLYRMTRRDDERDYPQADEHVILLTGIASPDRLLEELKRHTPHVSLLTFPDHHAYNAWDLKHLRHKLQSIGKDVRKLVVTTEKDATRLSAVLQPDDELANYIYVAPIRVEILQDKENLFNQTIIQYVRTHQRNRNLS